LFSLLKPTVCVIALVKNNVPWLCLLRAMYQFVEHVFYLLYVGHI
jgi:hypothetical protein